jgi:hypothetical protein
LLVVFKQHRIRAASLLYPGQSLLSNSARSLQNIQTERQLSDSESIWEKCIQTRWKMKKHVKIDCLAESAKWCVEECHVQIGKSSRQVQERL